MCWVQSIFSTGAHLQQNIAPNTTFWHSFETLHLNWKLHILAYLLIGNSLLSLELFCSSSHIANNYLFRKLRRRVIDIRQVEEIVQASELKHCDLAGLRGGCNTDFIQHSFSCYLILLNYLQTRQDLSKYSEGIGAQNQVILVCDGFVNLTMHCWVDFIFCNIKFCIWRYQRIFPEQVL